MKQEEKRRKLKRTLRWMGWVIAIQFVLFNISAAFYADKLTRLYTPSPDALTHKSKSSNLLAKTWRLFSGYRNYRSTNSDTPLSAFTTVKLKTSDNINLEAWYCPVDSSKGTIILFHGLMGNRSSCVQPAVEYMSLGYSVMLMETRGHREGTGQATTIGFKESEEVKLAYDYVHGLNESKIFLWGISMGAVEIIKAVAEYDLKPAGLMLEMPFGSLQDHVKARVRSIGFPSQPASFFITFWIGAERGFNALGFRVVKYASKIRCPVLLQFGTKDHLVQRKEIDEVYAAISSKNKKLVIYEGAGHQYLSGYDPVSWRMEAESFMNSLSN
jgi:uncharacterized protein